MARILVVDDETNIRLMVRLALQKAGHEVLTASDGVEGLAHFGDGSACDVVLVDQRMPGLTGLDVLREIRRRRPGARTIMITAFGTIDLAVEAMKSGATDFLRKPFTANVLRGAVAAALEAGASPPSGDAAPVAFSLTTLNGFRIAAPIGGGSQVGGEIRHTFEVRAPDASTSGCEVVLPPYVVELVKAKADRDQLPGGDRFWQALCEEVVANYIWQNSALPTDRVIVVDDVGTALCRWIDTVLHAGQ